MVFTAAFLLSLAGVPLHADTFFGDILGNQVFSGYGMASGGGVNNAIAQGFTMTQTISLGSVDTYLSQFQFGAGSSFALSIYSDSGNLPGTDLFDLSANLAPASSGSPQLITWTGTGSLTLTSGTKYWLELYATNPNSPTGSSLQWDGALDQSFAQVNPTGPGATDVGQLRTVNNGGVFSGSPNTSELRTTFQLNSAVPEPGSGAMLGVAGLVLASVRRRSGCAGQ